LVVADNDQGAESSWFNGKWNLQPSELNSVAASDNVKFIHHREVTRGEASGMVDRGGMTGLPRPCMLRHFLTRRSKVRRVESG